MIALRQDNVSIRGIARQLWKEGFRMGTGDNGEEWADRISETKISSLLDSNGVESALAVVVGVDLRPQVALDAFLATLDVTGEKTDRIGATEFRGLYEGFCEVNKVRPEEKSRIGTLLSKREGITLKKSNGKRWVYGVKVRA